MSRPLRLEHPGAIWHVTSRGNQRQDVYLDDLDRQRWLGLLARTVALCSWRLHAYVQMGNHYHLVVETPEPTLSRGMRQLNGEYGQAFNRRHGRVGHLFQGRFHAVLVERESHLLELARYVVLNPVRAGLVLAARDWPWSSYRAAAGEASVPPWLETAWTLAQFGGSTRRYAQFVAEGRGVPFNPAARLRGQIYLGGERFVRRAQGRAAALVQEPEIPRPQREPAPLAVEDVLPKILGALGVTPEALLQYRRVRARERALVAYALRRYGHAPLGAVAPLLGVSAWQVSHLAKAGERLWAGSGLEPVVRAADHRLQT